MTVKSPCINKCKLGPGGWCVDCLREMRDIANWSTYTDEQKYNILFEIKRKHDDGNSSC